uniref:Kinesin-like ATPase n=1 Tax=Carcinus maenas virus 1 TaxID=2704945 RepID=A0A6G9HDD2_9VIRU|nr:kinesin-like ATPase [Carcinus maenas virus 1]
MPERGIDVLKTLAENAVPLFKKDVHALFHNCVLLVVETLVHEFRNINTIKRWESVLEKVDRRHREFTTLAQKLQIDSSDKILELLENLHVKLHTTTPKNDFYLAKNTMEGYLDTLVEDIAQHIAKAEKLRDDELFFKNMEWDPQIPLTMQYLYEKITGKITEGLNDVLRTIADIIKEELDVIDGNDSAEIDQIRKNLNRALEEIREGGSNNSVTKKQFLNTVRHGIRLLVNKHGKRQYLSEDGPREPIKNETCGSYSVIDNMCVDPNLIYKFVALYEFYKNGLRIEEAELQFTNLRYENVLDICKGSTYNTYYENVYNIMSAALSKFESEPKCSRIRKNFNFHLFMIVRRILSEVFANPFALTKNLSLPDNANLEDSKDYVKKLKDGNLILSNDKFMKRPHIINLAMILKKFGKTDTDLANDAYELYNRYKKEFITRVGKYMDSTYETLKKSNEENCDDDDNNNNGVVNNPLFSDRSVYTNLVSKLQDMAGGKKLDDMDDILTTILNMENKYVKYITENELSLPKIKKTRDDDDEDDDDEDDDDDDDRVEQYNNVADELKREWDRFKYHTISYDESLLGKTKQDNSRLINMLNEIVNDEEDVGGLVSTFKKILLTDMWKDSEKINEDVMLLKKSVTNAKKALMDAETEKIKNLVQNGNFSDDVKSKLSKYIENDAKIKYNLELIAEKKIEPVIIETFLDKQGGEDAHRLIKLKDERNELIKKVGELETVRVNYEKIQQLLKNDTNDAELVSSILNLVEQTKKDEEQIIDYEADIRRHLRTIDALETRLHEKMEHDDVVVEEMKAKHEGAVETCKEETEKLRSAHEALTEKHDNLMREKTALYDKYNELGTTINECGENEAKLNETIGLVTDLETKLSKNTLDETKCQKELSEVNQNMANITENLSKVESEMSEKNNQIYIDREKDLENYSKEIESLKKEISKLRDTIKYSKRDAHNNMIKISNLYKTIDNVQTYEELIDAINTHNEAQRKTAETAARENGKILDILMANNVDGGIDGLSDLLQQTEKTNRQLERIYKNIKTDLCTVFSQYGVKSEMCAGVSPDDDDDGDITHRLSLLQDTSLPQLVTLLAEKEKHLNTIEQITKQQEKEITELKNSLAEKNKLFETLQRNFNKLVNEYNSDGNTNKGKLQELNAEIKSLQNEKKEMEKRYKKNKDSDGEKMNTLNGKIKLLEDIKTKLTDDAKRFSKEYQKAESEIKRLQNENKSLCEKQTSVVEALRKKGIDANVLREQLETLIKNKNALEKDILELNTLNRQLVGQYEIGVSELREEYDQQMLGKDKIIKDLNEKLQGINSKLETTNVQFADLENELYVFRKYKEDTERANLEMKSRLEYQDTNYENEAARTKKLTSEIVKLKSIIHNLEKTNSFLRESVDDLKTKNDELDRNIESLGKLQKQNQYLTNEKNKLLRELKELKFVKNEHDKFIKEVELFITNVGDYKFNAQENEELISVLRVIEDQYNKLKGQNTNYATLVKDYEKRLETYKSKLTNIPDEEVLDELSEKYSRAQKNYEEHVKRLTQEVNTCNDELSGFGVKLKSVYNAKDELQRKLEALQLENERLKRECHSVEYKMDSLKHEEIVAQNCEERLQQVHEKRIEKFGENINELIGKIEEKKGVFDKYGKGNRKKQFYSRLRQHNIDDLSAELKLPKDCGNNSAETMIFLKDIDSRYDTVDKYITDVYDAYSDLFQLGRVYVRMKPPVSSGIYKYDVRNPVVKIIDGNNPFDKNKFIANNKTFDIDSYFDENITNADIFKTVETTLSAVKKNKSVFIVVYGQTGSGKSYTITGSDNDKGLLYHVYQYARTLSDVHLRLYGLYNAKMYDLTKITNGVLVGESRPPDTARIQTVTSCKMIKNVTYAEMEKLLKTGTILRKTQFNDRSSRAHSFIDLYLPTLEASIVLVDLCGNEKTSALPDVPTVKSESAYINTSLMEISTHLLQRFRESNPAMLSGKLKTIFDHYMRGKEVKINTIFHIHKYLTDNTSVNDSIITSTNLTLQRANDISTV